MKYGLSEKQLEEIIERLKQRWTFTELHPGSHLPVKPRQECPRHCQEKQAGKDEKVEKVDCHFKIFYSFSVLYKYSLISILSFSL